MRGLLLSSVMVAVSSYTGLVTVCARPSRMVTFTLVSKVPSQLPMAVFASPLMVFASHFKPASLEIASPQLAAVLSVKVEFLTDN